MKAKIISLSCRSMRQLKTILTFLFLILILTSCGSLVQDVNPNRLPKSDAKLVVHGYLSPQDTVLAVKVEKNKTLFGTTQIINTNGNYSDGSLPIKDATVTISDGTKTVRLLFNALNFNEYRISAKALPIVVGKTYSLKVSAPEGLLAESSCMIPVQVSIKEVKRDSVVARYNSSQFDKTIRIMWQDPVGKGNYYKIQSGVSIEYTQPAQGTQPEIKYINWNEFYFRENGASNLLSDAQNDGATMASPQGRLNYGYYGGNTNTKILKTVVYLISCDKNYYDYHQAIFNDNNNPFSEPSLTPSNIVGGFGCFAGFNTSEVVLK